MSYILFFIVNWSHHWFANIFTASYVSVEGNSVKQMSFKLIKPININWISLNNRERSSVSLGEFAMEFREDMDRDELETLCQEMVRKCSEENIFCVFFMRKIAKVVTFSKKNFSTHLKRKSFETFHSAVSGKVQNCRHSDVPCGKYL